MKSFIILLIVAGYIFLEGSFSLIERSIMKQDDALTLVKLTVAMEAEGETKEGKLAVAYVIWNRAKQWNKSPSDVVLAPMQFSCWNTDSSTRCRLDQISNEIMDDCELAVVTAYNRAKPDPTNGATHYLNEELTRKLRGGTLPQWTEKLTKVATIGKHAFYR